MFSLFVRTSILLFLLSFSRHLPAQNRHKIDSLQKTLQTAKSDTAKARSLLLISDAFLSSKPDTAILFSGQALRLLEESDNKTLIALTYNQLGTAKRRKGDYVSSLSNYFKGLEMLGADSLSVIHGKIMNNVGSTYRELGNLDLALDAYLEAAGIFRTHGVRLDEGKVYGNIGALYGLLGQYEKELEYEDKAYLIFSELNFTPGIAGILGNKAGTYRKMNQPAKALEMAEKAIAICRETGNKAGETVGLEVIANVAHMQGDYDKAIEQYRQIISMRETMSDKNGIVSVMLNIGGVYNEKGDYKTAISEFEKALVLINETKSLIHKESAYSQLAFAYEQTGDFKKALQCQKETTILRDSIVNDKKNEEMTRKEVQFEFSQKQAEQEKQLAVGAENAKRQRLLLYAFMIGFALMVALSFVVYRGYRNKQKANVEINKQKLMLEEKNKDITDSINYARRIQAAVLPDEKILSAAVKDAFILNRPRDIVSGDFYWFARKNNFLYIAAADCTGHGVPGALVSVVGINALQQLIEQEGTPDTSALLGKLHRQVILAMNKDVNLRETQDGMDIGLVRIDLASRAAQFSGAGRPLFYMTEGEEKIRQIGGDRSSIAGVKLFDDTTPYTLHELKLEKQTTLYLFSDGIVDQFGGPGGHSGGKKFLTRRLVELLESAQNLPLAEQRKKIEKEMDAWRGGQQQTDDMLMIGFTV